MRQYYLSEARSRVGAQNLYAQHNLNGDMTPHQHQSPQCLDQTPNCHLEWATRGHEHRTLPHNQVAHIIAPHTYTKRPVTQSTGSVRTQA